MYQSTSQACLINEPNIKEGNNAEGPLNEPVRMRDISVDISDMYARLNKASKINQL